MIQFKDPLYLCLLLLLPVIAWRMHTAKQSTIRLSTTINISGIKSTATMRARFFLSIMKMIGLGLLIIALARPQQTSAEREYETSGIDIILALDISGSMLAEDFKPANRINVAKSEAIKFISGRKSDRIGLVVFAGKSYTQCPLTLDYDILKKLVQEVEVGMIQDGTAIGLAIANAVNRLRDSSGKSQIVILLTDGDNNSGNIDPITAAELARSFAIRIYTVGIGTGGLVPFPIDDPIFGKRYVQAQVAIDETTLKRIADITDGLYFPARDATMLARVYERINKLEKTEFKVQEYTSYQELYHRFLIPGILLLLLELFITNIFFLKIP